jgi:hypothetical protein
MLNPDLMAKVARKLDQLGLHYAFVDGAIVEFLLDRPDLSPMRPPHHSLRSPTMKCHFYQAQSNFCA